MATTLGNFYVGATGMQASQYALNTTAHNITNAGTEGYSRQQVVMADLRQLPSARISRDLVPKLPM